MGRVVLYYFHVADQGSFFLFSFLISFFLYYVLKRMERRLLLMLIMVGIFVSQAMEDNAEPLTDGTERNGTERNFQWKTEIFQAISQSRSIARKCLIPRDTTNHHTSIETNGARVQGEHVHSLTTATAAKVQSY